MPKVDLSQIEQTNRTGYPPPYNQDVIGRFYRRLGEATGLKDIGVSHCVLEPGAWSSQRHWHEGIDEDDDETVLRAGDCAVFPKDVPNGHHLINRSDRPCRFLAIDGRSGEGDCHYPDADLHWDMSAERYRHKDGNPY